MSFFGEKSFFWAKRKKKLLKKDSFVIFFKLNSFLFWFKKILCEFFAITVTTVTTVTIVTIVGPSVGP